MEFHFLGTGAGLPSKERNVSSLALRFFQKRKMVWLFDCGEATQHQFLHSRLTLSTLTKIFITHLHGDHIFGLPGLLCSRSAQGATEPLTLYGPKGLEEFVETSLRLSKSYVNYERQYIVVNEGELFIENGLTVQVSKLDHVIESYAYKIIEEDKRGSLDEVRLRAEGIKPGPIYKQIKEGQTVRLADGRTINGADYVGESKRGRQVVVAGDTRIVPSLKTFAYEADLLIHEGTFRGDMGEQADEFGHSTITDVAALAKEAKVDKLIITHISSRYAGIKEQLEEEARAVFVNSDIAADMMVYELSE